MKSCLRTFDLIIWDWAGTLRREGGELNPVIPMQVFSLYKNSIVSNCISKDMILEWCAIQGLDIFFSQENIVCQESNSKKPDAIMYDKLCRQINVRPNSSLVIGDSKVDYLFSKNINAEFLHIDHFNIDFFQ